MRLHAIDPHDLAGFIESTMRAYAEQKVALGGIPADEATRQAAAEAAQLFPDGRLAPGHDVLLAVDEDGQQIGHLWLAPSPAIPGTAFVYDIQVDPAHRGRGHGRQLMELAHDWAREHGYDSVRLHVFGGNRPAIALYESLGYEVTDLVMKLDL